MSYNIKTDLLTVKEVSLILKLSVLTIYKYIKERKLEAIEFGGHYRIERNTLINFIRSHRIGRAATDNIQSPQETSNIYERRNKSNINGEYDEYE